MCRLTYHVPWSRTAGDSRKGKEKGLHEFRAKRFERRDGEHSRGSDHPPRTGDLCSIVQTSYRRVGCNVGFLFIEMLVTKTERLTPEEIDVLSDSEDVA